MKPVGLLVIPERPFFVYYAVQMSDIQHFAEKTAFRRYLKVKK